MGLLAENLKKIRIDKGLTQSELGQITGLTGNWISQFETGKREPSLQVLLKLVNALDIGIDILVGREPENKVRLMILKPVQVEISCELKAAIYLIKKQIHAEELLIILQDEKLKIEIRQLIHDFGGFVIERI